MPCFRQKLNQPTVILIVKQIYLIAISIIYHEICLVI